MKHYLILSLFIFSLLPLQTQIWEEVTMPFDYEFIYNIIQINDEVYVSKFNRDLGPNGNYANYKYSDGEWVRAENDTIYEVLGKPFSFAQYKNKVIVSCRNGIYLSIDSAKHWRQLPAPSIYGTHILDFDISQNGILAISEVGYKQTFRFDEANNKWEQIYENKNDTTKLFLIHQIESNSTHLFGLQQNIVNPWKSNDTLSGGIFISTDRGDSWTVTLKDSSLVSIFANDEVLIANTTFGNLLKSEDSGQSWSVDYIGTLINYYSEDGDRLLGSSNPLGIIESKDKGKTWKVLNNNIVDSKIYKKADRYFFKDYLNLTYETDDNFKNIRRSNLKNYNGNLLSIHTQKDTLFTSGGIRRGVLYSTDYGSSWNTYYTELEKQGIWVIDFVRDSNQVYCFVPYGYYSSLDYGKTFEFNLNQFRGFLLLSDRILLYGNNGIRTSKDYGKHFELVDTNVLKKEYKISKIVQVSDGGLLAFTMDNGVYKSTDNAETWEKIVDTLPTDNAFASIRSFYEFDGVYYAINDVPPRILESTNKGTSWQKIDIDLFDNIKYFDLLMLDKNSIVISSFDSKVNGLRVSNNQGKTWEQIDSDLPQIEGELKNYSIIGWSGNYVYIDLGFTASNTYTNKLFRTTLEKLGITPTSVETQPERNYLYTFPPYPNPAKSEVKVLFYWDINLPMTVNDISIYNLDGKKITTQGNLRIDKQANHYGNIVWDCSTAEPGVYLISIKHGTVERTVKVVVE